MAKQTDRILQDCQTESTCGLHMLQRTQSGHLSIFSSISQSKYRGSWSIVKLRLPRLFGFSSVYADGPTEAVKNSKTDNASTTPGSGHPILPVEALAHLYVEKESGWDRVKSIFETDHRGKSSEEMNIMSLTLAQVFVITFFCKYVPVAKFAKKEFVREHQATVFRTRLEAIRRMKDTIFMKAAAEGGWMAARVTGFSASFLLLSQMISSYRNKTSVIEYSIASAVTGGLARWNLGLPGFITGSVVGACLGSAIGLIAFSFLSTYDLTQEERHIRTVMAKLEVERSIIGDDAFHKRVEEAVKEQQQQEKQQQIANQSTS